MHFTFLFYVIYVLISFYFFFFFFFFWGGGGGVLTLNTPARPNNMTFADGLAPKEPTPFTNKVRRCLITRSCEVQKPWGIGLANQSEIWQASEQQCCWDVCQISEWYHPINTQSHDLRVYVRFYEWRPRLSTALIQAHLFHNTIHVDSMLIH